MNIALVHDSFTQYGGAERVIEQLHEIFPAAPVYTLVLDRKFRKKYRSWDIRASWLQIFYNFFSQFKYFLPLIPLAVRSLDLSKYDIVISSSSGFVKNIKLPESVMHINYCHTPTRFLWTDAGYLAQETPVWIRPIVRLFLKWMKKWDYNGAQRVTRFIANSKEVQRRIKAYYHTDSMVIYPGIDTEFWHPTRKKTNYFLLAGRLQAHKKNDLIVEIFNELGWPLRLAGTGRQEKYLKSIAKVNITFLGQLSDEQLRDEYSGALAFIYPQIEDFGLMPLEAAACATATIAYSEGGASETIVPGVTGELFEKRSKEKIKDILTNWQALNYRNFQLQNQAKKFSRRLFKENITNFINTNLNENSGRP